ncbi:PorP/SprF family type IX secretion system membrane protein [Maribacter sp. MMG018]|uniref:PorP/SprF family type IX secretion system membrane protein n=1 Tax=Maribacter sp. MMG018 TaxID=2822688 RepID=UPI001B3637F1|nr:type IX secretion system membrane protein PorP/SprF [Maribacter sp. MMG018]MBQ4914931.1 PorP/SprF family type IX secretion system membrane protein [Maribacter sp. MMG018]
MRKICGALLICFVVVGLRAQEPELPSDYRQQNITEYNSSLLNPAYALDKNNPSSIAFWSRWQWQSIDLDPSTLFLNYSFKINDESAAGVGFFQHNTGLFLNTGGALNYAYNIELNEKVSVGLGINVFGYMQELSDKRFFTPNPIQTELTNDFVLQVAPGINVKIDRFSIGLSSENLFDYNFTTKERSTSSEGRVFFTLASYDIPMSVLASDPNSFLRPSVYFKSVPGYDSQFGVSTLLSTNKFWAQLGYNSYYGISGGAGGRFFKRLSIGALVEFGTSTDLKGTDPSFELVTSYKLGRLGAPEEKLQEELIAEEEKKDVVENELTRMEKVALREKEKEQERLAKINQKRAKDSIRKANRQAELALKESKIEAERKKDSLKKAQEAAALAKAETLDRQKKLDSINKAKEASLALELQKKQDSIVNAEKAMAEAATKKEELERLARKKEVVTPQAGEKYEEVTKQGSLEPGYYLIANVFGTKRYFDAFMADLKKKGLNPQSFYRETNKYNYVYLGRYDSINEARKARDSKLGGKYTEKLWIFRVVGE